MGNNSNEIKTIRIKNWYLGVPDIDNVLMLRVVFKFMMPRTYFYTTYFDLLNPSFY